MTADGKFKPGDQVICQFDGPGTILKSAKSSALVRFDDKSLDDRRVYLNMMRHETPNDVSVRQHNAAMSAWRKQRPDTEHVHVSHNHRWGRSQEETGASASPTTPHAMRAAAAELLLLADWFERKPVKP